MIKSMYIIRGSKVEDYDAFVGRIFDLLDVLEQIEKVLRLSVVLTENAPPNISIIPFKKEKIAVISIKSESPFDSQYLINTNGYRGKFEVNEALPVKYEKTWTDGFITPGICLLTLFNQKKGISYDQFIDTWHNSHTPLSLKLHPLWHYNRNVVAINADENQEKWDGIVEEHVRTKKELLNPFLFFGKPSKIIQNMIAVYKDTKNFIDYPSMQPYLAQEYHIKS
jgi:hypothetical protein